MPDDDKHPRISDVSWRPPNMNRRAFSGGCLAGLATLTSVGLKSTSAAAYKKRKDTIAEITAHICQSKAQPDGPYSLEYRGVGTIIIKAKSKNGTLGIVIPTVPARRFRAKQVLDLQSVDGADHLIVCVLHNHWDHAKHLQLFKEHLLNPHAPPNSSRPPAER